MQHGGTKPKRTRGDSRNTNMGKPKFVEQRQESVNLDPIKPLNQKQRTYLELLDSRTVIAATGYAGSSKAQPLYSKVLTVEGWKTMGEIEVGDNVITPDNNVSKVLGTFSFEDKPVYKFKLKSGREVESCEDHLWLVRKVSKSCRGKALPKEIMTTSGIIENINEYNISLPLVKSIGSRADKPFFVDPYVMGILISEGCLVSGVSFTTADEYILGRVTDWSESNNFHIVKLGDSISYGIRDKGKGYPNRLKEYLKSVGLYGHKSHEKFIPEEYFNGSIDQKFELLRGLMDGDGSSATTRRKNGGSVYYSTTSDVLAKQIHALAISLGCYATISERRSFFTYKGEKKQGRNSYSIYMNHPTPKTMFNLERKKYGCSEQYQGGKYELMDKIESVEYVSNQNVKCILIDSEDHLYITDNYVVTHNTYLPTATACDLFRTGKINKIIFCRPAISNSKSLGYFAGSADEKMAIWLAPVMQILKDRLGQGGLEVALKKGDIVFQPLETIKGSSFNDSWIIVDEAEDLTVDEIKKVITRVGKDSKMILAGDITQSELNDRSGLKWLIDFAQRHDLGEHFGHVDFNHPNDIVRSEAVKKFIVCIERDNRAKKDNKD